MANQNLQVAVHIKMPLIRSKASFVRKIFVFTMILSLASNTFFVATIFLNRRHLKTENTLLSHVNISLAKDTSVQTILEKSADLVASQASIPAPANKTSKVDQSQILAKLERNTKSWSAGLSSLVTHNVRKTLDTLKGKKGLILDIGANFCAYSQSILQKCKNCRVIAFEPVPPYAKICHERLAPFGSRVVSIENFAVSDQNGNMTLWISPDNLGWNTLEADQKDGTQFPVDIATRTLDSYFFDVRPDVLGEKGENNVVFMKIDTEGSEWRVLNGARKFLTKLKNAKKPLPPLLIEIAWGPKKHPHWDKEIEEFENLFEHLGYKRVDYNVTRTDDVLFLPK